MAPNQIHEQRQKLQTVAEQLKLEFIGLDKIIDQISGEHFKNYNISKIVRNDFGVKIFYGGENEFFDYDNRKFYKATLKHGCLIGNIREVK